jgi:hypothetical protein
MNIQFEWPASRQPVALKRNLSVDNALVFNAATGAFDEHGAGGEPDLLLFYWHLARPVLLNLCTRRLCLLNGVEIACGAVHPLRDESEIQAGHFKLLIAPGGDSEVEEQNFYQFIYPNNAWATANKVPEVEEILPNGGDYVNDLRYFDEVILAQDKGDDVLKTLEVEYKRFLIWQEIDGGYYGGVAGQADHILKTDRRFDLIREQIKDKTLTECIVAREFLMEKVWPELERGEYAPGNLQR